MSAAKLSFRLAGAAALSMPGAAAAQSLGQILLPQIPLQTPGLPQGVRDRLRPELTPAPLHLAGIDIAATLDAALGSTSNVLGAQSERRADGFAEWTPQLVATLDGGPDRDLRIVADYDAKRFFGTPAKRQDGYHIGLSGMYGFGASGLFSASAFHQRSYEDQLAGSFPAQGGGAVAIDQTQAQALLSRGFNRVKLTAAVTYDRLRYRDTVTTTDAVLPQSYRNADVMRAATRIDYTLAAGTALFAQIGWRDTAFAPRAAFADRSSREWRAIGGIAADVTGLIRLSAGIGTYARRYRAPPDTASAPVFGRMAGLAWDLRGAYYVTALTTLTLHATRDYIDANSARSPSYAATTLGAQLDHEVLRNLLLSVAIAQENDRFRLISRGDHLRDYAFWADYWLSAHLLVKPRIEYLDRTSHGHDAGPNIPELRTQLALSLRN